jgi:hypothetical protein
MYDPRIGRWLSLDPLAAKYPSLSAYNFAGNMPIIANDPNGEYIYIVISQGTSKEEAKIQVATMLKIIESLSQTPEGAAKIQEAIDNPDTNIYIAVGQITQPSQSNDNTNSTTQGKVVGDTYKTPSGRNVKVAEMGELKIPLLKDPTPFAGISINPDAKNYFILIDAEQDNDYKVQILGHEWIAHVVDGSDAKKEHIDFGETYVGKPDHRTKAYSFHKNLDKAKDTQLVGKYRSEYAQQNAVRVRGKESPSSNNNKTEPPKP